MISIIKRIYWQIIEAGLIKRLNKVKLLKKCDLGEENKDTLSKKERSLSIKLRACQSRIIDLM